MSRYIDPHTRDLADRKKIVVRLKRAYTAMNQLTVKHWICSTTKIKPTSAKLKT